MDVFRLVCRGGLRGVGPGLETQLVVVSYGESIYTLIELIEAGKMNLDARRWLDMKKLGLR